MLTDDFQQALNAGESLSIPLRKLLTETGARAAGIWECWAGQLGGLGFEAVDDIPDGVQREFVAATQVVPLSAIGLGIVQAVVNRSPAVVAADLQESRPEFSGNWLVRFQSPQSLSLPILLGDKVIGVLAIALSESVSPGTEPWTTLECLAGSLAQPLAKKLSSHPGIR